MTIYFPIAEASINLFLILGLGGCVGVLSGLFGVGGGFLMTPLLVVIGIAPAIAASTGANQIVAASVSGLIGHWRIDNVDFRMGFVLIAGGVAGSLVGVRVFDLLRSIGQIGLAVSILYVVMLGSLGSLMLVESTYCGDNSGWACNELGRHYAEGQIVATDAARAIGYFARACELRFQAGCLSLLDLDHPREAPPRLFDLRLLVREGGRNLLDMPERDLYARACDHGWRFACAKLSPAVSN